MGNHTETLQVDYDPAVISYGELLKLAWDSHNPYRRVMSKQYQNIIFAHDEVQEKQSREIKEFLKEQHQGMIFTEIFPFTCFYPAENYHQKYYLQNVSALMIEFEKIYPDFQDFVNSTAAARVNGYVAGYGSSASLSGELAELGLSNDGSDFLQRLVRERPTF